MALTKKQKQVYDFIYYYIQDNTYAPTQLEIKEYFGFKSLGSVQDYIRYLSQAGYLKNDSNAVRGLEPLISLEPEQTVYEQNSTVSLPLMGHVAAGYPIEKMEQDEHIQVPDYMVGLGEHYALRVQGESMINDGIFDGDIVILKHQKQVENGQTAVVMVDGAATIKKVYKNDNTLELRAANEKMPPIILTHQNWEIRGILVGLFRSY